MQVIGPSQAGTHQSRQGDTDTMDSTLLRNLIHQFYAHSKGVISWTTLSCFPTVIMFLTVPLPQGVRPIYQNHERIWGHDGMHPQQLLHHLTRLLIDRVITSKRDNITCGEIKILQQYNIIVTRLILQDPCRPHTFHHPVLVGKLLKGPIVINGYHGTRSSTTIGHPTRKICLAIRWGPPTVRTVKTR